jgi:predicted phosphodiesterase
MRVVLASDIHNNLLTVPTLRRFTQDHLTVLAGDFTVNGGRMEAPLARRLATLGDTVVAVSGNHDAPGIMRALERRGVTVLDHTDGVRTIGGLKLAGFEDPLAFQGEDFPSGIRTGLSFGDIPDGHERYLEAVDERWKWWQALPERPQVLIVHQESIGRALANLIWDADPDGAPLAILVGHTHVQRLDRYGPISTVNGGTAGAGGVFGLGTQSVGLALMDFDTATGSLAATDLVQMNPATSAARAQRVITATPDCDETLVFCHEEPNLPDPPR